MRNLYRRALLAAMTPSTSPSEVLTLEHRERPHFAIVTLSFGVTHAKSYRTLASQFSTGAHGPG